MKRAVAKIRAECRLALHMAEVAKKKGIPLFRVITPGGFELHFLHEEGYAKGVRGGPGSEPRDSPAVRLAAGGSPVRRSRDDPSGRRAPQDASFKRKPRGGQSGLGTDIAMSRAGKGRRT
jgi:hypothetical protein